MLKFRSAYTKEPTLCKCKIPDQYFKNKKVTKLLELWQLWLKKTRTEKNGEYMSVLQ